MQSFLAFLGVVFLGLVLWFCFDYNSFIKSVDISHRAFLQRIVDNQLKSPENTKINGNDYLIIPLK